MEPGPFATTVAGRAWPRCIVETVAQLHAEPGAPTHDAYGPLRLAEEVVDDSYLSQTCFAGCKIVPVGRTTAALEEPGALPLVEFFGLLVATMRRMR